MSKNKPPRRHKSETQIAFDRARDELCSHILSCGVLEAAPEHQKDWFDDTMDYLAERYDMLSDEEIVSLRQIGERFCKPVIKQSEGALATN